jgi:hypothetical protein
MASLSLAKVNLFNFFEVVLTLSYGRAFKQIG